jgi:hypothetical protein
VLNNKRKIELLILKNYSLKKELSMCKDILKEAEKEFSKIYNKMFFPDGKQNTVNKNSTEIKKSSNSPTIEPEKKDYDEQIKKVIRKKKDETFKKLFKSIALKAHPDRLENVSDFEKGQKERIFKKSLAAIEAEDLLTLLEMARRLNIEPPQLEKRHIDKVNKEINEIKKELKLIKSTYLWVWHNSENEDEKERILNELLRKVDPRPGHIN